MDDLTKMFVVGRLAKPDAIDWLLGDDETARKLARRCHELQGQLDAIADSHADGKVPLRAVERMNARLGPQLEAARRERDVALRSLDVDALRPLAGPEAEACWDAMSVAQRRAVLETLGVKVVLLRREKRGPGFEPESVSFVWRQS